MLDKVPSHARVDRICLHSVVAGWNRAHLWAVLTVLHGMPAWTTYQKGVCLSIDPSVCLSVRQTCDLWQKERKLCLLSYTTWNIIYRSFVTRRMVGGGDLFYLFYLRFWLRLMVRDCREWTAGCIFRIPAADTVYMALVISYRIVFT